MNKKQPNIKKLSANIEKIVETPPAKPPKRKPLRGSFESAIAKLRQPK